MTKRALLPLLLLSLSFSVQCQKHLRVDPPSLTAVNTDPAAYDRTRNLNTILEINTGDLAGNLNFIRESIVTKTAAICAVVKADAYGHGLNLLMPTLNNSGVEALCFTDNEEAVIARTSGFLRRLIRIRTATTAEIEATIPLNVEETIGNLAQAETVSRIGEMHGRSIDVHWNLNTGGMSRNGLDLSTDKGRQDAQTMLELPFIKTVGIMTHFPTENAEDIVKGKHLFSEQATWLMEVGGLARNSVTLHIANTAATVLVPDSHLDMVRIGSLIYGVPPAAYSCPELRTLMTLKSEIAAINEYPQGNTVSYDRTHVLTRATRIANVPVGYSNGYNRALSNRTEVLIRGKRHPVLGLISMNTIAVDVTDTPDASAGDEVVLIGRQGNNEISILELERYSQVYNGELSIIIGATNRRIAN